MSMPASAQSEPRKPASTGLKVLAFVLDLILAFVAAGYLVGYLTGNLTDGTFNLEGVPALIVLALIVVYFAVSRRLGGTVWQRVLGTRDFRAPFNRGCDAVRETGASAVPTVLPYAGLDFASLFRRLLVLDVALTLASMALAVLVDPKVLPAVLQSHAWPETLSFNDRLRVGTVVLLYCVGAAATWSFQRWGRLLYTAVALYGCFGPLVTWQPGAQSALTSVVTAVSYMVTGATLVFAWKIMQANFSRPVAAPA